MFYFGSEVKVTSKKKKHYHKKLKKIEWTQVSPLSSFPCSKECFIIFINMKNIIITYTISRKHEKIRLPGNYTEVSSSSEKGLSCCGFDFGCSECFEYLMHVSEKCLSFHDACYLMLWENVLTLRLIQAFYSTSMKLWRIF